jgi:hypothetical protein
VLSKISKWAVVFALCVTLGFHWGLLQSVAWVGMIVDYSRQGSIKEAVCKTFDGQHPCPLCKLVRAGKASEKKTEAQQSTRQVDLFAGQTASFVFPPLPDSSYSVPPPAASRTEVPPLPPPRPFFG